MNTLVSKGVLPTASYPEIELSEPKQADHGDFACTFAMAAAKAAGRPPRAIAEALASELASDPDIYKIDVAGPGFLNLTLTPAFVASFLPSILASANLSATQDTAHYARVAAQTPHRINVEFVSVNPNGPITIGSGRGAAYGSTLCNVLEAAGNTVHREYYINDGTSSEQMRLFAESVKAILENRPVPDNGYKGDYVYDVASQLAEYMKTGKELRFDPSIKARWERAMSSFDPARLRGRTPEQLRALPARFGIANRLVVIHVSDDVITIGSDRPADQIDFSDPAFGGRRVVVDAIPTSTFDLYFKYDYDFVFLHESPLSKLHDAILLTPAKERASQMTMTWGPEIVNVELIINGTPKKAMTIPATLGADLKYIFEYSCLVGAHTVPLLNSPRQLQASPVWSGDTLTLTYSEIPDELPPETLSVGSLEWCQVNSQFLMIEAQRKAMQLMGVEYDTWFSEQALHTSGMVEREVNHLIANHAADDQPNRRKLKLARGGVIEDVEVEVQTKAVNDEGEVVQDAAGVFPTLWLRSTKFGDDMDRVLRRRDGRTTYIASDVSYHKDKLNRPENGDRMITVLGPDHHGYIGRLTAVVAAMLAPKHQTEDENSPELTEIDAKLYRSKAERDTCRRALAEAREKLTVQIYQLVRFMKDGKPAPMRKRDGNIYALIDLINEIGEKVKPSGTTEEKQEAGKDVARFFYLMRHHDSTFDFDLDLAEKQSDDNPVFYVQYAHARICSVLSKAKDAGFAIPEAVAATEDMHPREKTLLLKILELPNEIARCADDYAVNRLATYAIELARTYHHFYDACRVIQAEQPELTKQRIAYCQAARIALKTVLDLLGVSAPERMEREAVVEASV